MKKRLLKEFQESNEIQGVKVELQQNDISRWLLTIEGPKGSFYYGGKFKFKLTFPDNYPFKQPEIVLQTRIVHIWLRRQEICFKQCCYSFDRTWVPRKRMRELILELKSIFFYDNYINRASTMIKERKLFETNKQLYQQKVNEVIVYEYFDQQNIFLNFIAYRNHFYSLLHTNPDQVFIDLFY